MLWFATPGKFNAKSAKVFAKGRKGMSELMNIFVRMEF